MEPQGNLFGERSLTRSELQAPFETDAEGHPRASSSSRLYRKEETGIALPLGHHGRAVSGVATASCARRMKRWTISVESTHFRPPRAGLHSHLRLRRYFELGSQVVQKLVDRGYRADDWTVVGL